MESSKGLGGAAPELGAAAAPSPPRPPRSAAPWSTESPGVEAPKDSFGGENEQFEETFKHFLKKKT